MNEFQFKTFFPTCSIVRELCTDNKTVLADVSADMETIRRLEKKGYLVYIENNLVYCEKMSVQKNNNIISSLNDITVYIPLIISAITLITTFFL